GKRQNDVKCEDEDATGSCNCSSVLTAQFHVSLLGLLEDGKLAHTGVPAASATAGMLNAEKRSNGGSQCANPTVHSMGTTTQRQNEVKDDDGDDSNKERSVNSSEGNRLVRHPSKEKVVPDYVPD
uniref:Uncharacterized protein n=1 Tax=Serinus canaria TaxID=9135 RepID=A0A8C9MS20_SERCA